MKKEVFALAILILLPALSLVVLSGLTELTDGITQDLYEARDMALSDQWSEAESTARDAIDAWTGASDFTHLILHHRDIEDVTITFYSLMGSIYRQDEAGVKSTVELLSEQLYDICELERIRLGSVF